MPHITISTRLSAHAEAMKEGKQRSSGVEEVEQINFFAPH
jgi:hypothetical protein